MGEDANSVLCDNNKINIQTKITNNLASQKYFLVGKSEWQQRLEMLIY